MNQKVIMSPGPEVEVFTLETNRKVCNIRILSVEPIQFDEINEFHAEQEAIELPELKQLIREIYLDTETLFVIEYKLLEKSK